MNNPSKNARDALAHRENQCGVHCSGAKFRFKDGFFECSIDHILRNDGDKCPHVKQSIIDRRKITVEETEEALMRMGLELEKREDGNTYIKGGKENARVLLQLSYKYGYDSDPSFKRIFEIIKEAAQ